MIIKTNGENKCFHILSRGIIIDGDYILIARAQNTHNTFLPGGHLEFKENHLELCWIKISEMEKENLLPYSMRKIIENIHKRNNTLNYFSEI